MLVCWPEEVSSDLVATVSNSVYSAVDSCAGYRSNDNTAEIEVSCKENPSEQLNYMYNKHMCLKITELTRQCWQLQRWKISLA